MNLVLGRHVIEDDEPTLPEVLTKWAPRPRHSEAIDRRAAIGIVSSPSPSYGFWSDTTSVQPYRPCTRNASHDIRGGVLSCPLLEGGEGWVGVW